MRPGVIMTATTVAMNCIYHRAFRYFISNGGWVSMSKKNGLVVGDVRFPVKRWGTEFGGASEFSVAVEVMRASRAIHHGIQDVLDKYNLSMVQWTILTLVYFADQQQMQLGKLAKMMGVHTTTVSNAIDQLETAKWMAREPLNRRTILATLTKFGLERLRKVQRDLVSRRFGIVPTPRTRLDAVVVALKSAKLIG